VHASRNEAGRMPALPGTKCILAPSLKSIVIPDASAARTRNAFAGGGCEPGPRLPRHQRAGQLGPGSNTRVPIAFRDWARVTAGMTWGGTRVYTVTEKAPALPGAKHTLTPSPKNHSSSRTLAPPERGTRSLAAVASRDPAYPGINAQVSWVPALTRACQSLAAIGRV
jgi:hypothetical protein